MTYVMRDSAGQIVAVSRLDHASSPGDGQEWVPIEDGAPELMDFINRMSPGEGGERPESGGSPLQTELAHTDIGMVRVLEDLIDLLIDQGVIVFTDLPVEAQRKLSERQSRRAQLRRISWMDDDSDLI